MIGNSLRNQLTTLAIPAVPVQAPPPRVGQPEDDHRVTGWHHARVSFDLVVWAMDAGGTDDDVRAANELCLQGEHLGGEPDLRVTAFYAALTSRWPDGHAPGRGGSP